eukprot:1136391-Pelagomonas_calceolata.AAC.2
MLEQACRLEVQVASLPEVLGGKLSQWIPEETTINLLPTKLGSLLLLRTTLAKPTYPCLVGSAIWQDGTSVSILTIKLKMEHMFFKTVMMDKLFSCAESIVPFEPDFQDFFETQPFFAASSEFSI